MIYHVALSNASYQKIEYKKDEYPLKRLRHIQRTYGFGHLKETISSQQCSINTVRTVQYRTSVLEIKLCLFVVIPLRIISFVIIIQKWVRGNYERDDISIQQDAFTVEVTKSLLVINHPKFVYYRSFTNQSFRNPLDRFTCTVYVLFSLVFHISLTYKQPNV